jgi:hypothetical protein
MRRQLARSAGVPCAQTREPRERRRDRSPIRKIRDQSIVAYTDALSECSPKFSVFHTHSSVVRVKTPKFFFYSIA